MKSASGTVFLASMSLTLTLLFPIQTLADNAVSLGIFPNVNSSQLVRHHQSFKRYLQKRLGQMVHLGSAHDLPSFVRATREGTFDLVLTAPHLGRLAQLESRYQPVAQTAHNVQAFFVTHKDSGIKTLAELKNKTVSMMPSHALIVQLAERQLKTIGLEDGKNIVFRRTRTHNNALFAALRRESDAAITGVLIWRSLKPEHKSAMRIVAKSDMGPGLFLMAHPRWSELDIKRLREIVFEFSDSSFSRNYLHNGYVRLREQTLRQMDSYLPNTIKQISSRDVEKN